MLGFLLMGLGLVTAPIQNAISRRFEWHADAFAVKITGNREAFASALEKLGRINMADRDPHPLVEFLFYSHPSIGKRVAAACAIEDSS